MLNKKDLQKEKILLLLNQKGYLEFLITTLIISLLTITGVFISHYNSDKIIRRIRIIETVIEPTNHTDNFTAELNPKTITATFN